MGQNVNIPSEGPGTETVDLRDALEERYLAYALSTIMNRALPDVRDGLKPVHRRILYVMREMRLDPRGGFKKCAKVVGEVMGNYHPHGDQAIYDALVRLAQGFAVRYPLVDGQGNFGNIDGDNAAAMRYTEARMTDVANLLLLGIDEDAVDFRISYDGDGREPVVLPGAFPNLLANGASGIAVGMATSIPPHNAGELCDAALHLIKHPNAGVDKLLEFVPGPDLPTGGIIVSSASDIREAYTTGRGSLRVRARWEQEKLKGGGYRIIISEIPYQVQKGKLIEAIAEMLQARKLPMLGDILDESAEDLRIVIEPKSRSVDPDLLMESLFRLTDLETRLSYNMNVLSHGRVPNVIGLRQILLEWLEHRKEVLVRRSNHRLGKINQRLEILDGYLVAFLNIDEVIRIIREEDEPKRELMERFSLSDVQAEAVLNLRLRALRKLEEIEIRSERDSLAEEREAIEALLASDERQWKTLAYEIRKVRDQFKGDSDDIRRRTSFAEMPTIDVEDIQQAMIEKEPITIVVSQKGWIRALRGHLADTEGLAFKSGDKLKRAFHAETTDRILVFSTCGRFYTLEAAKLPGGRGHGEPVRIMIDMESEHEIAEVFKHDPDRRLLVASKDGNGFVVAEKEVVANTRKGKRVLNLPNGGRAAVCIPVIGDRVATIGDNRKLLIFPLEQLPEMTRGKGVRLQRYRDGGLADAVVFEATQGLSWRDSAGRMHNRGLAELKDWIGERAQAGRAPPQGFPKRNRFGGDGL